MFGSYIRQIMIFSTMLVGCNFITAEELAYRQGQGGSNDCTDIWFLDADGDGVGGSASLFACTAPSASYTQITGDCDDENPSISPNAVEDCGTPIDEDCSGTKNASNPLEQPPLDCTEYFADRDGDLFGDDQDLVCNCEPGAVYTALSGGDCYDQLTTVNPDQEEICGDGFDNDCDGSANGCGYTTDFSLLSAQQIRGATAQAYAGENLAVGALLPDALPAVAVVSSGAEGGAGRIDILDADTLSTATETLSTMNRVASIIGEQDSDFGEVISAYGNISGSEDVDLLVSAPTWTDVEGRSTGAVYLFEGPFVGNRAAATAELVLVGSGASDRFGSAVASVDSQIWVGAQGSDLGAINAGAVFVFSSDGEALHQLTANEPSMNFGSAMSTPTDLNGDGVLDIAVGAFGANGDKGAVLVYWSASTLQAVAPSDADVAWNGVLSGENAGQNVQAVGDVTGDGYVDLLIGTPNTSRAYVVSAFETSTSLLDEATATLVGDVESALGYSIVDIGDFNGDGQADVVLGGFLGSQIAIAYGPLLGEYGREEMVILENRATDQLGWSMAGGLDFTGDDIPELFVGARTASDGLNKNGLVFMLEGRGL